MRRQASPRRVQDALGELAGAAKDGVLALSVGVGLGVLSEMMQAELKEVVRPTRKHLDALMSRSLQDVRLAALMLDGIELKGRCCVVALGVATEGVKVPLRLWDGSTETRPLPRLLADRHHEHLRRAGQPPT
ncbi:MAG: hypothetical protein ABSG95_15295 [Solirubrobacteraceae bacterium]